MIPAHRREFPAMLDSLGVKSVAEIGVGRGWFAKTLLASHINRYIGIDPWPNPIDAERRIEALELLADPRVEIIEQSSADVAGSISDGSIDCVYIDSNHDYDSVYNDLVQWWPKCRRMIAGHDYGLWNHASGCPFGVIPAVERFASERGLAINVTGAASTSAADRLHAAYLALFEPPGDEGDNIPSFVILR